MLWTCYYSSLTCVCYRGNIILLGQEINAMHYNAMPKLEKVLELEVVPGSWYN